MIVVCEPQCVGISHEKVNSGFLTLLHHAFPGEPIRFYADPSHGAVIRRILAHDRAAVDAIEYRDLPVRDPRALRGVIHYHRQFRRVLQDALDAGSREVLFLSTSPVLLHVLKRLKREPAFEAIHCALVCHAEFEDIANDRYQPVKATQIAGMSLLERLRTTPVIELPNKARALVARKLSERYVQAWQTRFRIREQLLWRANEHYAFIALAPHIVRNAARYIDVDAIHLHTVEMPYNFAPPSPPPANAHLKVATFGFGDPAALREVLAHLDRMNVTRPYEVRVIGMDNRGLENHPHVSCPSPGKQLTREEMERLAGDIDAFLILFDHDRYRLSCSGAIFEAMSYVKPVLHIGNPCVVAFDRPEAPIGFATADYEALARTLAAMIEDYPGHRPALDERRRNLLRLREQLGMDALAPKLRAVLRR